MSERITPEVERVFSQLLWIEHRRARIVESVSAHFEKSKVERLLEKEGLFTPPLRNEPSFSQLLDERSPLVFLEDLAITVEKHDAATITCLRKHVSVYQEHVDEQILFGSRTSGQEAGRTFLASSKPAMKGRISLSIAEAIQAIFTLMYNGLPNEKNYFLAVRPFGSSSIHFRRSPHIYSWAKAGADPKFLYSVKAEWIKGILDILAPEAQFVTSKAIERGHPFGLAHIFEKGVHAEL